MPVYACVWLCVCVCVFFVCVCARAPVVVCSILSVLLRAGLDVRAIVCVLSVYSENVFFCVCAYSCVRASCMDVNVCMCVCARVCIIMCVCVCVFVKGV